MAVQRSSSGQSASPLQAGRTQALSSKTALPQSTTWHAAAREQLPGVPHSESPQPSSQAGGGGDEVLSLAGPRHTPTLQVCAPLTPAQSAPASQLTKCVSPLSVVMALPQPAISQSAVSAAPHVLKLAHIAARPLVVIIFLHRALPVVSHHSQLRFAGRLRPVVVVELLPQRAHSFAEAPEL